MDMNFDQVQEAELQDAVTAANELYNVITRLKRLGLLTPEEDERTREQIDAITDTLVRKLPSERAEG